MSFNLLKKGNNICSTILEIKFLLLKKLLHPFMTLKKGYFLLFIATALQAQQIKTIQLKPLQEKVFTAIVPLGSILELSFDDLDADSKTINTKLNT